MQSYRKQYLQESSIYKKVKSSRKKGGGKEVTLKLLPQLVFKGGKVIIHSLVIKDIGLPCPYYRFYRIEV